MRDHSLFPVEITQYDAWVIRELLHNCALDKVQKKYPLSDDEFSRLKRLKLVEGRRPNLFVAARIAEATHGTVDYIRYRAFDKAHYKKMVIAFIKKFGSASRSEIDNLLYEKLPDILSHDQKKNKIRNLLQEMSKNDRSIRRQGGPGRHGKWILVED